MRAPSTKVRFSDAQKLLDYGFNQYSYSQLAKKGNILTQLPVSKGVNSSVNAVFVEDAGSLLKKGNSRNIEQVVSLPESINAPIRKGEELGKVDYILEGQTICSVPIVADEDVKQIFEQTFSYMNRNRDIIKKQEKKYNIDTTLINRLILEEVGILPENIFESKICTVCNSNLIHSYRAEKERAGRNIAILGMK